MKDTYVYQGPRTLSAGDRKTQQHNPRRQQRIVSENGFRSTVPGNALHTSSCPGRGRVEWNRSTVHVF